MGIGSIVAARRRELGLTLEEIAVHVGVSRSTVMKWEKGHIREMRRDKLVKLAEILRLDPAALVEGESRAEPPLPGEPYRVESLSRVPIVGSVKAGYNGLAYEDIEGYETMADLKNPEEYILLRVTGDSMQPQIMPGDLVLMHKQEDVESGEIAVCLIDGDEGTVKKVIKHDGTIVLQAFNPNVPPRILTGANLAGFHIAGKVMSLVRQF